MTTTTIKNLTILDSRQVANFLQPVYADTYPNNRGIKEEMFMNETFYEHLLSYIEDKLTNPAVTLFAAMQGRTIIGTIGIEVTDQNAASGEVWGFYVVPALQGQGIGKKLWAKLIDSEVVAALNKLRLTVSKDSVRAISFYEKNNFKIVSEVEWNWPSWTEQHLLNQYWIMQRTSK